MPPAPALRDARADDLDAVRELLAECFEPYRREFPADAGDAYLSEVTDLDRRSGTAELIVAAVGTTVAGCVTFLPDSADDVHPWPPGGSVLRLLAVHPAHRGRGIAALLTDECLTRARARGASFVGLHTAPFMEAAQQVYLRAGFKRAEGHDFDPFEHYGGDAPEADRNRLWGVAYVRTLSEPGRAQ